MGVRAQVRGQVVRFVAVGVLTAAVDYGCYRGLLAADLPVSPAKALAFVAGTALSYLLHRAWTFGSDQHAVRAFVVVYGVTLGVNVTVNAMALMALGGVPGRITLAWLVAQSVASALNFVGLRTYVFGRRDG